MFSIAEQTFFMLEPAKKNPPIPANRLQGTRMDTGG